MPFIKKNLICKEKPDPDTKVKLITKIKKHNQLYFGALILLLSNTDFFQNIGFKERSNMALKKIEE